MNSYRVCGPVTDDTVTPSFTAGYRLCEARTVVSSPCDGGFCADSGAAICIAGAGAELSCPSPFPNRIAGWQGFETETVGCGCACVDDTDCGYIGWWDTDDTCSGKSDDDPTCGKGGAAVGMLPSSPLEPAGSCAPVKATPQNPPIPLADPLTLCCTAAP